MARRTGAPVYCPAGEVFILEDINDFVRFPGFGPFETYSPEHTVKDGDKLQLAGLRDRRHRHARPQPGPRDVLDPGREGDLLRRRALPGLGRPHGPAGLRPRDADGARSRRCWTRCRTTRACSRATWSRRRSAPSARPTRSCASSPAGERSSRRRAARTTCCPTSRTSAPGSSRPPRRSSTRAGYGRIETPTFEATQLFSRTVGEATDVVQKEMYTFPDGCGDSLTLRPEGTAPIVRAYLEHGMHKDAAAGEALVPLATSSATSARRPAASASSGRSARRRSARADPAVDAELILLLGGAAGGDRRARREARARHARPAGRRAPPTARSSRRTCGRNEDQLSRGGRRAASTSTRCARSTPSTSPRSG